MAVPERCKANNIISLFQSVQTELTYAALLIFQIKVLSVSLLFLKIFRLNSLGYQTPIQKFYTNLCTCFSFVEAWGPNRVFGKTEEYGFLSVKKVKTKFLSK